MEQGQEHDAPHDAVVDKTEVLEQVKGAILVYLTLLESGEWGTPSLEEVQAAGLLNRALARL